MSKLKPFFVPPRRLTLALGYAGTVAVFLWVCSHFYLPGKGFTYLVEFGERQEWRYLPELRALGHYDLPDAVGYDGQYYAQIAMRPRLGDPAVRRAMDNLPYRARRILFCWTAWALGGGDPARALEIYAVQNIAAWLLLAALMLRWFPPVSWGNWARWAAVLASFGLCVSVRGALTDGPGLLLVAGGMALLERGWPWLAAGLLGLSGLGKETNVLAAAAFAPGNRERRGWARAAARWALVLLPLVLWIAFLSWRYGGAGGGGARNFAPPFAGYLRECRQVWELGIRGTPVVRGKVLVLVALSTQWLFFVLRPRWSDPWWRLGAACALLMVVLGDAVWEGFPSAVSRSVLPMTLAFNLLVPRGRRWGAVLLLGNLSAFASPKVLAPPGHETFRCEAPAALRPPDGGPAVAAVFDGSWYRPERSWFEYWLWSDGDAEVVLRNADAFAVEAGVSFALRSDDRRTVAVRAGGRLLWRGTLEPGVSSLVTLPRVRFDPGDNRWSFATDRPPLPVTGEEPRLQAFSLRDLKIAVLEKSR